MHDKPRPRTLFKPRERKANFALSVLVTAARLFVVLALVACVAGCGVVLGIVKAYTETAPELNLAQIDEQAQTSFFYDAEGDLITDYKGSIDRVLVSIEDMPENLQKAFVAVEDARFYTHNGVDVKRILGAFVSNLTSSGTQGGSTITQQLIKLSLLSSEQSYKRKIQEAYLAMQLETIYDKNQILESYLNTIYLGESYYGVKTAAHGYFGKELSELTLRECAMLAGTARSPYYYNPRRNFFTRETPDVTDNRTDYALRQMYENGFIGYDEYIAALDPAAATVLESAPGSGAIYQYPYYIEYAVEDVIDELLKLNSLENTAANRSAMESELRTGGYHVYLCIDTQMQDIVERTLARWNDYPLLRDPSDAIYRQRNTDGTYEEIIQPQAACAIVDYRTGELKAVVGGRTEPTAYKTLNRATDMTMPVGSAIKPISVYAPALELGASPASVVYNMPVPIHGWNDGGGEDYYPSNYGGGGYTGAVTFRRAMVNSYNTAAAQALMYYVGVDRSSEFLRAMGVEDANINENAFGLALGSSGVTPVQMAVAFGTLGNAGVYNEAISFSRIEDSDGNVIINRRATQVKRVVFSEGTAYMAVDMMKGVVESGTGTKAQISGQTVAGKTGTNSDYKGVTFAGMTGWYSGCVWIGHDNYKALSSKATGGNYAAPLWREIMAQIHNYNALANRDIIEKAPESLGLVKVTTCGVSGLLATEACRNDAMKYRTVTDYWREGTQPTAYCNMHQQLSLCTDTGLLATAYCPNVQSSGAIVVPIGHPLYDYIDGYQSAMRTYLGQFSTLRLTSDEYYNSLLIAGATCQIHSEAWVEQQRQWSASGTAQEAQALVDNAYALLINRGGELTGEQYVSISYCIRQLEAILSSYPMTGLDEAMSNLRYAMSILP